MDSQANFYIGYEASLLKNIFFNSSMGLIEADLNLNVRLFNPAACKLINDDKELTGLSVLDLIREKDAIREVATRLRSEDVKRFEGKWTPARTKYHTEFKMVVTLSRDDYYMVTGFLLMCEEVLFHTVCCICHKVKSPEGWIFLEELVNRSAALSHTYCPDCMPQALAQITKTQ
ncbi:MAG: PAS domain-containing protein [Candidatus Sumerlaeota bacterium]|nr:PAS domain-containing protein [Candidatus Sumerlaeota bacterium]